MGIIAEAVRIGFVKCHDAMPLEGLREAVLAALPPDGVELDVGSGSTPPLLAT